MKKEKYQSVICDFEGTHSLRRRLCGCRANALVHSGKKCFKGGQCEYIEVDELRVESRTAKGKWLNSWSSHMHF